MTRILAAALLCAASSVGCSTMNTMAAKSFGGNPSRLANARSAPRPHIQRAGYETPVGVVEVASGYCENLGSGPLSQANCNDMVNAGVSAVIDCNGCGLGCGDACGGGCYGGACHGGGPGAAGGACPCGFCNNVRQFLAQHCTCGGQGSCAACAKCRAVAQEMRNMVFDPRRHQTDATYNFNPGPPAAQVAYPYYTVRGPRDFFLNNPPSIGPY